MSLNDKEIEEYLMQIMDGEKSEDDLEDDREENEIFPQANFLEDLAEEHLVDVADVDDVVEEPPQSIEVTDTVVEEPPQSIVHVYPSTSQASSRAEDVKSLLLKVCNNTVVNDEDIENWNDDEVDDEIEIISDTDTEDDLEENILEPKLTYTEAVASVNKLIHWFKNENDANQVVDLINVHTRELRQLVEFINDA